MAEIDAEKLSRLLDIPVDRVREALRNLEQKGLINIRIEANREINRNPERGLRWMDQNNECPDCYGEGYIDGCGDCIQPCTTEGSVVCKRVCDNCYPKE